MSDRHREAKRLGEAGGDRKRIRLVYDILDEDRELVAAEPGGGVGGSERRRDAAGRCREDLVATGMPMGVVQALEVVEVDEQDRDLPAIPATALDGVLDAVAEQDPVREA